ncbi:MAG TPA: signal peptidase I [Solirubrobacteraceae bacterium]|nr:signal peptidase I [Solirubrobacteraceae bacterium]
MCDGRYRVGAVKPERSAADPALVEQLAASLPLGRPVRRRIGRRLLGVAAIALVGLGLALHQSVHQYKVTSGSMEPTLQVGQHVAAERPGVLKVGDIVVFHPPTGARARNPVCGAVLQGSGSSQPCDAAVPQESGAVFVKRVVAGPGDLIAIVNGHVVRNGVRESDPFIAPCAAGAACSFPTAVRVPPDEYYLLGDNRGVSDDSRFWGPVPSGWIIGTVVHCSLLDTVCHPVR